MKKEIKKKKKGINGQKKGRSFEKEIAKELSLWWSNNEKEDVFYCTAGSGSRFTSRKKQGKDTSFSCGDIGLTDPMGKPLLDLLSIEIKRGYSDKLDLLSFVDSKNKNHELLDWILKAKKEVLEAKRQDFIIIFKRDRKEKMVCVSNKFIKKMDIKIESGREIIMVFHSVKYRLINYSDFFKHFTPDHVETK